MALLAKRKVPTLRAGTISLTLTYHGGKLDGVWNARLTDQEGQRVSPGGERYRSVGGALFEQKERSVNEGGLAVETVVETPFAAHREYLTALMKDIETDINEDLAGP